MSTVALYARYSKLNVVLHKVATLKREERLIFHDADGHFQTFCKFALLTAASPLISLTRMVRSAVFLFTQNGRSLFEFLGALAQPFVALSCLSGTLLSSLVYVISSNQSSFHVSMRRTYAYFEAWVNQINLKSSQLTSYAHRVSSATDCIGSDANNHVWTTAPCLQPVLENGLHRRGGIMDVERLRKIFPFLQIKDVKREKDKIVIQSEYVDENVHYSACNGVFQHYKTSSTWCCCYRVEAVYDRALCCAVGKGSCTSMLNPNDSCGIATCSVCNCIGGCCCFNKLDGEANPFSAGCFGDFGIVGFTKGR